LFRAILMLNLTPVSGVFIVSSRRLEMRLFVALVCTMAVFMVGCKTCDSGARKGCGKCPKAGTESKCAKSAEKKCCGTCGGDKASPAADKKCCGTCTKAEVKKVEAPKVEAPKAEAPKVEAPKVEAPKAAAPVAEPAPMPAK
jgi:hypothetical protein